MDNKFFKAKDLQKTGNRFFDNTSNFDLENVELLSEAIDKLTDIIKQYRKIAGDIFDDISELRHEKTKILRSIISYGPVTLEENNSIQQKINDIDEKIASLEKTIEEEKPETKIEEMNSRLTTLKQALSNRRGS